MKVSHILYKVDNLDIAVREWRDKGFTVEYGKKDNPYNALIYFSTGPYLELLEHTALPRFFRWVLRIIGHKKIVGRLESWEKSQEGLISVCLENYGKDFKEEKKILKQYNQRYFEVAGKRLDTHNRLLKFRSLFPHDTQIPFFMTYFDVDPKPSNYTHPNGVIGIDHISFGTSPEFIPLIRELCDDEMLELFIGKGVRDLHFKKKMPTKDESIANLILTMQAPVLRLVNTINELPNKLVKTLVEVKNTKEAHIDEAS